MCFILALVVVVLATSSVAAAEDSDIIDASNIDSAFSDLSSNVTAPAHACIPCFNAYLPAGSHLYGTCRGNVVNSIGAGHSIVCKMGCHSMSGPLFNCQTKEGWYTVNAAGLSGRSCSAQLGCCPCSSREQAQEVEAKKLRDYLERTEAESRKIDQLPEPVAVEAPKPRRHRLAEMAVKTTQPQQDARASMPPPPPMSSATPPREGSLAAQALAHVNSGNATVGADGVILGCVKPGTYAVKAAAVYPASVRPFSGSYRCDGISPGAHFIVTTACDSSGAWCQGQPVDKAGTNPLCWSLFGNPWVWVECSHL